MATFTQDGSLSSFEAEEDGDLTTAYHGSGEFVSRSDYREVDGVMIPFEFEISRMAGDEKYPFWRASIESYEINPVGRAIRSGGQSGREGNPVSWVIRSGG